MTKIRVAPFLLPLLLLAPGSCAPVERGERPEPAPSADAGPLFRDVSETHLPAGATEGFTMDARAADLDGDGDLDLVLASEFAPNLLLLNDGSGRFEDASARLPRSERDSEDVGIADFDGDGRLDIALVSEDDAVNELYLADGQGGFVDASARIPVEGISNALIVADVDGDGRPDLLIGNRGQNRVLLGDGRGGFRDETETRLPAGKETTQDLELGDVDGDGDLDLVVANEGRNQLLLNDGRGAFSEDAELERLPEPAGAQKSREGDFGDVDGDGDLDLVFANVQDPQDRLYINDGRGVFTDATEERFPADGEFTYEAELVDLDGDGDLDYVAGDLADVRGRRHDKPFRVYLNDGRGHFTDATGRVLPASAAGNGFDVESADFDGDGVPDLYLASRGGSDRLLLGLGRTR